MLDYQVLISELDAHGSGHRLNTAFDTPNGRYLPVWNLLPQLRGVAVDGRLTPVQVEVHSALPVATSLFGQGTTFWAEDLEGLYSALLSSSARRAGR